MAASKPTCPPKARLFLVDDEPLVRKGLALLINLQPDLTVCGETADEVSARDQIAALDPDLVVVDLKLDEGNGFALIGYLHREHPRTKILVFSMHDQLPYVDHAFELGAHGYVTKDDGLEYAVEAIQSLLRGDSFLSQTLAAKRLGQFSSPPPPPSSH